MDFVTVVFEKELELLKTQARSFDLYSPEHVKNFWVVVNDSQRVADQIDKNWWGSLAPYVQILTASDLGVPEYGTGWDSQQLCKLVMASKSHQMYCLVFDAKTWLVREFKPSEFFGADGINIGLNTIQPDFKQGWDFLVKEFGITDPGRQLGPAGVPYVFRTEFVRGLFSYIERKHHQSFVSWYVKHSLYPTLITEFLTYSAWVCKISNNYKSFITGKQPWRPVNIARGEIAQFDEKLAEMQLPETLTVSIHRDGLSQLTPEQNAQWTNFLKEKNLLD